MRKIALAALVLLLTARPLARSQEPSPEALGVTGQGSAVIGGDMAAAEEEAVWDAKRNAVEQAAGIFLHARTLGSKFAIEEDEIRSRSDGFVQKWELVPESRHVETLEGSRVLHLEIHASVALLPVLHRLADMKDVYDDLERPRLRIEIPGDARARRAQEALVAAFRKQGFEVAADGPAEILIRGRLETVPTLRLGDRSSPQGLGETVAACRAQLTVQVVSEASEDVLLTTRAETTGQSFQSDGEAADRAAEGAAPVLLKQSESLFVDQLLARWVHERQEGYVAVVQASGLSPRGCDLLRRQIDEMRGFRRMLEDKETRNGLQLRFITRLDARALRTRLASAALDADHLTVLSHRGPIIVCSAGAPPGR